MVSLKYQFMVVFFEADETIEIVRISDTSFSEENYEEIKNPSARISVSAKFNGSEYSAIVIQLGMTAEDLEITEDRCVDLLRKKKKSINDLLIRIPKVHSGKRMVYEPLHNIFTSDEESVKSRSKAAKNVKPSISRTRSADIELPSITEVEFQPGVPRPSSSYDYHLSQITDVLDSEKSKPLMSFLVKKLNLIATRTNELLSKVEEIKEDQKTIKETLLDIQIKNGSCSKINDKMDLRNRMPLTPREMQIFDSELVQDKQQYESFVSFFSDSLIN